MADHDGPVIERRILWVRAQRVILDRDLAALYGVEVKRLNEQVKRNAARFPPDFAFEMTEEEFASLSTDFRGAISDRYR